MTETGATGTSEVSSPTPVVRIDGLSMIYTGPPQVTALQRCSFRIERGEYVAITGPSGSGKTTLLSLLGLLDTPTTSPRRRRLPERRIRPLCGRLCPSRMSRL